MYHVALKQTTVSNVMWGRPILVGPGQSEVGATASCPNFCNVLAPETVRTYLFENIANILHKHKVVDCLLVMKPKKPTSPLTPVTHLNIL